MKKRKTASGFDELVASCDPSARAIAQCLRMLAEEATSLSMPLTRDALAAAIKACAAESHVVPSDADADARPAAENMSRPPGTALH